MKINSHYAQLEKNYLFSQINRRVAEFTERHPEQPIIRLGIGDVTKPLCPAVVEALQKAATEMGQADTFHGYGPEQGYDFLREAVAQHYLGFGVELETDEIFISDGAKSDCSNILDLFSADNHVLVPDPVYPVYVDTNVMAGREIEFIDATQENQFLPMPDLSKKADIIYICSPNNPTGAVYDRDQLQQWVDYANDQHALILFDAAYEAFIDQPQYPHSIFEISGAKTCAIELCSLSKTAGFTGTRCGYTIVPHALEFEGVQINSMWLRRQTTKFNGVAYIVQRAAQAAFSPEGKEQLAQAIAYYKANAKMLADALDEMGIWYTGGKCSPYIWLKCPNQMDSWEFFDFMLEKAHVVGTPGAGFGRNGKHFFRLTAFGTAENTARAIEQFRSQIL